MYCKACGKKLESDYRTCPHCGRPVDLLSGGTGFWDIHTDRRKRKPEPDATADAAPQERPDPVPPRRVDPPSPPRSARRVTAHALAELALVILLILQIVSFVQIGGLRRQLAQARLDHEQLSQRLKQLEAAAQETPTPVPAEAAQPPEGTPGAALPFELSLRDLTPGDDGSYALTADAVAVWSDIGEAHYLVTLEGPDGKPVADPEGRAINRRDVGTETEFSIPAEWLVEPGEYKLQITAGDAVRQSNPITLKKALAPE